LRKAYLRNKVTHRSKPELVVRKSTFVVHRRSDMAVFYDNKGIENI